MSRQLKKRYCECGRELEKRCLICSECRAINRQIQTDKAQHSYYQTEKYKAYKKEYMREYMRERRRKIKADETSDYIYRLEKTIRQIKKLSEEFPCGYLEVDEFNEKDKSPDDMIVFMISVIRKKCMEVLK